LRFSVFSQSRFCLRRVPGAILVGILAASIVAFVSGIAPGPGAWIGTPPNPAPIMFKADLSAVLNFRFFGVLLSIFVMAWSTRRAP
jgi:AGZA family xanthine/uracil permease-like MFS transporter